MRGARDQLAQTRPFHLIGVQAYRSANRQILDCRRCRNNSDGWETGKEPLRLRTSTLASMKLRQGWGTPTFVLVRRSVGAEVHTPLTARNEIEFPSLPSRRNLKEFIKRRVASFLEVLIRLKPATSSLLASVVDSDGSVLNL